ncbi:MAG: hypothetical protein L0Y72_11135 [Gemmataceae bacterium]|nr:hypothetical protein [Gemmataceae bacterium]MCI0641893.1 hypothetical protein [Gemmataceae bacterium]MCI0739590.1 hypothetical protein [Gemmataceae bacterium]
MKWTLGLGMLCFVAGLARADSADDAVIKALKKVGSVYVSRSEQGEKPIIQIDFRITGDKDAVQVAAAMQELVRLRHLENVQFVGRAFNDDAMKELAQLSNLRVIRLFNTKVTDKGVKELNGLEALQSFSYTGSGLTDAGMIELAKHKQLTALEIIDAPITDKGAMELVGLQNLKRLLLQNSQIPAESMEVLRELMPRLRFVERSFG